MMTKRKWKGTEIIEDAGLFTHYHVFCPDYIVDFTISNFQISSILLYRDSPHLDLQYILEVFSVKIQPQFVHLLASDHEVKRNIA